MPPIFFRLVEIVCPGLVTNQMDLIIFCRNRQFAGDNRTIDPIIVHNNVLSTGDYGFGAKRYKFREFLMWYLERDG